LVFGFGRRFDFRFDFRDRPTVTPFGYGGYPVGGPYGSPYGQFQFPRRGLEFDFNRGGGCPGCASEGLRFRYR
jgi:hypothetical protein